jgi:hypothetical protein
MESLFVKTRLQLPAPFLSQVLKRFDNLTSSLEQDKNAALIELSYANTRLATTGESR